MTTITTSTTFGSQNLRNTLWAALAVIVGAGVSFGAWTIVTSGDASPAASAPAVTTSAVPQLSPAEEVALINQLGTAAAIPATQLTPTQEVALISELGAIAGS